MTPRETLFFDEWQACLRAHYIHVIRTHDTVTEPTLRHVLLTTGLSEDDLIALRAEALGGADEAHDTVEPDPAPIAIPLPDERDLPDDFAFEDESEPDVDTFDALVADEPDTPSAELSAADPDQETANSEMHAPPHTPPPSQLSLF